MKNLLTALALVIIAVLIVVLLSEPVMNISRKPTVFPKTGMFNNVKNAVLQNNPNVTQISMFWKMTVTNLNTGKSMTQRLHTPNRNGIYTIGRYDDGLSYKPDLDFSGQLSIDEGDKDKSYQTVSRDQAIIYKNENDEYVFENRSATNSCYNVKSKTPIKREKLTDELSVLVGECYLLNFKEVGKQLPSNDHTKVFHMK